MVEKKKKSNPFKRTFQRTKTGSTQPKSTAPNPFKQTFQSTKTGSTQSVNATKIPEQPAKPPPPPAPVGTDFRISANDPTTHAVNAGLGSFGAIQERQRDFSDLAGKQLTSTATPEEDARYAKLAGGALLAAPIIAATATWAIGLYGTSTVAQAATVGTSAAATGVAVNTASTAATTSLLTKMGMTSGATTLALTTIGTYPFAGFIQEEAIQTVGFAVEAAFKNGDIEGMEAGIALQEEFLNPSNVDKIIGSVPFANIVNELKDFFQAAQLKLAVDKKRLEDLRIQQTTGETTTEMWERINQEELDAEQTSRDDFRERQEDWLRFEQEAEAADREEQAAFWKAEREAERDREAEDRAAMAAFWNAYRQDSAASKANTAPSNLKFGLL